METRVTTIVTYQSRGGRLPPQDREILEIAEDGSFKMWRSVGSASEPATPIGRFNGKIDQTALTELKRQIAAANKVGEFRIPPDRESSIETVELSGTKASIRNTAEPTGAWGELIEHLRSLLASLTAYPQAAVGIEISPDLMAARLVHEGYEPLRLDLSKLEVKAVIRENGVRVGNWDGPIGGPNAEIQATPGWTYNLPFAHDLPITPDTTLRAYVWLALFDGSTKIPASLTSA